MSSIEEYLKKFNQQTAANTQAKVDAVNNTAAASSTLVKNDYGAQIKETEQSYNRLFDENNVQKIINERQIAESMANIGLTDSGLNRTQRTASQLSHANNQANIRRQQQAAIDTLSRAMQSELSEIETTRAAQESSIRTADYDSNYASAVSAYNAEQEAIAESTKAVTDALAAQAEQEDNDFKYVMGIMGDENKSSAYKDQVKNWYGTRYNKTPEDLDTLFGSSSTKFTVSGDYEIDSLGEYWTDEELKSVVQTHISNNEDAESLAARVERLANQKGWSEDTMYAYRNAILNRTNEIRAYSANPTLLNYTLVTKPDSYTGDVANTAVVSDQFGVQHTIEDIYYSIKVMHAKAEAEKFGEPDNWEKYVNTSAVKKAAKAAIKKIQENLGIKKN